MGILDSAHRHRLQALETVFGSERFASFNLQCRPVGASGKPKVCAGAGKTSRNHPDSAEDQSMEQRRQECKAFTDSGDSRGARGHRESEETGRTSKEQFPIFEMCLGSDSSIVPNDSFEENGDHLPHSVRRVRNIEWHVHVVPRDFESNE